MRYSTLAVAVSLLVKDTVLAGTIHGHRVWHGIGNRDVTVTDEVIETSTIIEYVTVEWNGDEATTTSSSSTAEPTTTTISIKSVTTTSTVPKATPTSSSSSSSSAASASPSPLQEAVFLPASKAPVASSTSAVQEAVFLPATTAIAAPVVVAAPTTLATVVKPETTAAPVIVAVKSTSAAPVASASAAPVSSTPSGSKRGISYNSALLADIFTSSSTVSWAYNWASSSDGLSTKLDFIPMLWGLNPTFTGAWTAAANKAIAAGSSALLAFNEPDLGEQSNIGVAAAAAGYKTYMQPFAGKVKLGSPSVTNGAAPMGLTYLKNFMSACSDCTIDFCAIHWYDSASNVEYFKNYMADAQTACGGRPIWITEFGASGSASQQASFLKTVIPWLESQDYIHRYAYFMASDGVLLSGNSLSSIGAAYVS